MNIFLTIAIILANAIAITIVYQFLKKLEKKELIIFLAINITVNYLLISLVYAISGIGIDATIHEASKNFVLYLFVPINMILFSSYIASRYMKLKLNEITREKFVRTLVNLSMLLIIVLIIEYFYFRSIQTNIDVTMNSIQNEQQANSITTNRIVTNQIN